MGRELSGSGLWGISPAGRHLRVQALRPVLARHSSGTFLAGYREDYEEPLLSVQDRF